MIYQILLSILNFKHILDKRIKYCKYYSKQRKNKWGCTQINVDVREQWNYVNPFNYLRKQTINEIVSFPWRIFKTQSRGNQKSTIVKRYEVSNLKLVWRLFSNMNLTFNIAYSNKFCIDFHLLFLSLDWPYYTER